MKPEPFGLSALLAGKYAWRRPRPSMIVPPGFVKCEDGPGTMCYIVPRTTLLRKSKQRRSPN